MPPKVDPWRNGPSIGHSCGLSAAFDFSMEPPQAAEQTPPRHGASLQPGSNQDFAAPQPGNQPSTASIPMRDEDVKIHKNAAGCVANEMDQLENEVIHFMTLSMEEKEKSEVLSGRLASVTREKEDLERQINELDQQLGQADGQDQDDGASADTISRVNAKTTRLRATAQKLESDFNVLALASGQHTKTIAELEEQLGATREHLAQSTQEEQRLREELQQTKAAARSDEKTNDELLRDIKTLEQECNELRTSNAWNSRRLVEAEETADTLSDLIRRKVSDLEDVRKAAAAQAETMRQELDGKQKEIEALRVTQNTLEARCDKAESALEEQPTVRHIYRPDGAAEAARSQREMEKDAAIKQLTEDLGRSQRRRVRAVAIGIDLSGSAAGSLTEGIKKMYAHLLGELRRSACQTFVMTVVHGPGDAAAVRTSFGDPWAAHEGVLEGCRAHGVEQHVACLRRIKEAAVSTGLVLDLQVVLLGDSNTNGASHVGAKEVCTDFASGNPTVHIHSVAVKKGTAEETEKYRKTLEAWHAWNYASSTGGNMVVWRQNSPLPDLSNLVY